VERITSIKVLLALTSIYKLHVHQMKVKTTFLNGYLKEKASMKQSKSFILLGNEKNIYKLIKSLYGLK
jgi:hypothetical protein